MPLVSNNTPLPVLNNILESPAQPQKSTERHNYFGPFQEQQYEEDPAT